MSGCKICVKLSCISFCRASEELVLNPCGYLFGEHLFNIASVLSESATAVRDGKTQSHARPNDL